MESFEEIIELFGDRYDFKYQTNRHKYVSDENITEEIKEDIIRLEEQKKVNMKYLYDIYCACYNYNQILCAYISIPENDLPVFISKKQLYKSKLDDRKKEIKNLMIKVFLNYDFEQCRYNQSDRLQRILDLFNEFLDFKKEGLEQFLNKVRIEDTFIEIGHFFAKFFDI